MCSLHTHPYEMLLLFTEEQDRKCHDLQFVSLCFLPCTVRFKSLYSTVLFSATSTWVSIFTNVHVHIVKFYHSFEQMPATSYTVSSMQSTGLKAKHFTG